MSPATTPRKPLDGITVLDLTVALAGPFATLILAGLGAKVIKLENPSRGDSCRTNAPYLGVTGPKLVRESEDDISVSALNRLRNKLGVTLNLKHPDARAVYADLVKMSDIVVENFSRGTLDRLGVGYAFARKVNPRLIYCSITGFGSSADASPAKAMDTIIQALSGTMMTSGGSGDPPIRVGLPVGDLTAPLFGAIRGSSPARKRSAWNIQNTEPSTRYTEWGYPSDSPGHRPGLTGLRRRLANTTMPCTAGCSAILQSVCSS